MAVQLDLYRDVQVPVVRVEHQALHVPVGYRLRHLQACAAEGQGVKNTTGAPTPSALTHTLAFSLVTVSVVGLQCALGSTYRPLP